jgi:hypothetical protein
MCCANTCEVLKAVHILQIYVWENSQNPKYEVFKTHALQLLCLFTVTDSKTIIVPVGFTDALFVCLCYDVRGRFPEGSIGHGKENMKKRALLDEVFQPVFLSNIRQH